MRRIVGRNECITTCGNDKVVLLYADIAEEDMPLLAKWQHDELIPCVLHITDDARVIICDKDKFYLNEDEYILRESEREKLLKTILHKTIEHPFALNRVKANGVPEYKPMKWYSWNVIALAYAEICKLVRDYFGERFYIIGEERSDNA